MARGLAAGVLGTAAMTAWQEASSRLMQSGEQERGGQPPADPWEQAPVPAKVARRIIEGVFRQDAPASQIPLLTNVMHWGYGAGWGTVFGLVAGSLPERRSLRSGLLFGGAVWGMSYVQLVPMGLYEPPWRYPASQVGLELSHHLAYGAGLGAGWAIADRV